MCAEPVAQADADGEHTVVDGDNNLPTANGKSVFDYSMSD